MAKKEFIFIFLQSYINWHLSSNIPDANQMKYVYFADVQNFRLTYLFERVHIALGNNLDCHLGNKGNIIQLFSQ